MDKQNKRKYLDKISETLTALRKLDYNDNNRDELLKLLHFSIISGESYQFAKTDDVEKCFNDIKADIEQITIKDEHALKSCFDAYKALCLFICSNIHEYYNADSNNKKKPFHFHNISSVLDIKPLKTTTHNYSENRESINAFNPEIDTANQELNIKAHVVLVKLSILVSELDFSLSCSNNYLSDAIETYAMLEFWYRYIHLNYRDTEIDTIVRIIKSKCSLLLAKSLYQRGDLMASIRFYGYGPDTYYTKHADEFQAEAKHDFQHFIDVRNFVHSISKMQNDPDQGSKYDGRRSDFDQIIKKYSRKDRIAVNGIDFSEIHFACEYLMHVEKIERELVHKLDYLDVLYDVISKEYEERDFVAFDKNAFCSLLNFIENTRVYILAGKVRKHCKTEVPVDDQAKGYYDRLHEFYMQAIGKNSYRDNANEYFRHYKYLEATLAMCKLHIAMAMEKHSKFIKRGKNTSIEDILEYRSLINDKLKVTTERLIEGLSAYSTKLKSAERNKHIMLFLPEDQCRIHNNALELDYFVCSSYLAPTNYHNERINLSRIQLDIENTLTKVLFAFYEYGSVALNDARSDIASHIETLKTNTDKINQQALILKGKIESDLSKTKNDVKTMIEKVKSEVNDAMKEVRTETRTETQNTKKHVEDSISVNNTKSIAYLGLFTAIISIFLTSWQSSEMFKDVDNLILINFSVSAILIVFVIILSILTFEFKRRKVDLGRVIVLIVLLFGAIYMFQEVYQGVHKKVAVQQDVYDSLDSLRSKLDSIQNHYRVGPLVSESLVDSSTHR